MYELTTKEALDAYTKELVPTVLSILELANCDPKLCNSIKAAIWNQKDASLNKLRDLMTERKERKNDYSQNFQPNQDNYNR